MRIIFLSAMLCVVAIGATAQWVGLDSKDVAALKTLLQKKDDGGAKALYDQWLRLAEGALAEDPHPIDTIRTEGLLQGDPRKTATQSALQDMRKMYALALAYRVGGERRYLDKLAVFLQAWASVNHPKGDPIDDTNLDPAIEAFDMVKEVLTAEQAAAIRDWLRSTAGTELTAIYNRPERATSHNNWHSHRLKIVGEIGFQLAIVIRRAGGTDFYSWVAPSGSSIRRSVDWLLPYLNGQKPHPEFVNSTVEFDRRRAQNGEAAFKAGTLFDPKNGVATLVLAAYFNINNHDDPMSLARQLLGTDLRYPTWQAVLNGLGQ
jgi:hypothetical protein